VPATPATTRKPHEHPGYRRRATLARRLINNRKGERPRRTPLSKAEGPVAGQGPCERGPEAVQFTFNLESGDRVIFRVPALPVLHAEPRRGRSMLACCDVDGAFVLLARTLALASCVEAGEG
jgi:hypothetical protein